VNLYSDGKAVDEYISATNTLRWLPGATRTGNQRKWQNFHCDLIALAHELAHAMDDVISHKGIDEVHAMRVENNARALFRAKVPGCENLYPRPGYDASVPDLDPDCDTAWAKYRPENVLPPRPQP